VIGLNLRQGIENSVDSKSRAAIGALIDANANNDISVANGSNAFINNVNAQSGHMIPAADVARLAPCALTIIGFIL